MGIADGKVDEYKRNFANGTNNPQLIDPPFLLELEEVQIGDKLLLHVQVPQSSQVHKHKGFAYGRTKDGNRKITDHERLSRVYLQKSNLYTEEKVFPYLKFEHFEPRLFLTARNLIRSRNPDHPWLVLTDEQMLKAAMLHRTDLREGESGYTLAAALIFGRDEIIRSILPHYRIDALVRVRDVDRYDDRDDIRTNLIDAYSRLSSFAAKHLPDPFFLVKDQRVSLRDKIFREVIANLIVHREYTNATPSRFIIHRDRVEVVNANKPHGRGPIDFHSFAPYSKNPVIAHFFVQIGRMDELGSGIRNIVRFLRSYAQGQYPVFEEDDVFRTIIPLPEIENPVDYGAERFVKEDQQPYAKGQKYIENHGVNVDDSAAQDNLVDVQVAKYFGNSMHSSLAELIISISQFNGYSGTWYADHLQISYSALASRLRRLRIMGLIEHQGSLKKGGYFLTEKGKVLLGQVDKARGHA